MVSLLFEVEFLVGGNVLHPVVMSLTYLFVFAVTDSTGGCVGSVKCLPWRDQVVDLRDVSMPFKLHIDLNISLVDGGLWPLDLYGVP